MKTVSTFVKNNPFVDSGLYTNFKQQGYWVKYAAAATLLTGIYLHVTSLLIGRDLFLQHVLTARFEHEEF